MVEQSVFDVSVCMMLSSLTILNTQSTSQGVYSCIVQDNSFVLSKNVSLMLHSQMNDSTESMFHIWICTACIHSTVIPYTANIQVNPAMDVL